MWILDSLSDLQLKRPFFSLWSTLGAAFLLLATFFSTNALYHPATYCVLSLALWLLWKQERSMLNTLFVPATSAMALFIFPGYLILFSILFTLAAGRALFPESFRLWKWGASALLFFVTFPIVSTWQSIPEITALLPAAITPLVYAAVMAFCVQFAIIPFSLRRDSVLEAFAQYVWKTSSQAHQLASETVALYTKIKALVRLKEENHKIQQDLEDYTERVVHQCHRLQEISTELSNTSIATLQQQILFLKEKLESVQDFATRMQYEQALHNKQKQVEQQEQLQMQKEHLLSRIINYNSSLENVRFAYANQDLQRSSGTNDHIEMFMDLVKARAEAM